MQSRIRIAVSLLSLVLLIATFVAASISPSHLQSHSLPAFIESGSNLISGFFNSSPVMLASTVSSISPSSVRAGEPGATLTVTGAGFVVGSIVRFNGLERSTTFVSPTTLTVSIQALDLTTVGLYPITVIAPDLSVSNAVNLSIIPSIGNLSPLTAPVGSGAFTLTVMGNGFVSGAVVKWNGSNRTTTFVNPTKLTAAINAADIASLGSFNVTVQNPAPTNLTTPAIKFFVTNAPPATQCPTEPDITLGDPGLINSGPARSQMWRNDNMWWGAFSNNTDGIYFYKQTSPTTWEQGALVDTNFVVGTFVAGAPDCLWNGTNLFILIQESTIAARLYKYSYSASTQTYSVVAGFPITLPLVGIGTSGGGKAYGTLAIDQDSTGRLWAAYSGAGIGGDGNLRVIFSTSPDHLTWDTTGVILASGMSTLTTEGTAILRFGTRMGVAWSDTVLSEDAFRFHNDADPPTTWGAKEIIDSGLGPLGLGTVAGKQITMKAAPDGRIFFVGNDNDGRSAHLHLYVRSAAGSWGNKTVVVPNYHAEPTKPVLLLDTDNSEIHVVYKDSAIGVNGLNGQTFITQSSMNNLAFNSACILIDTSDSTVATSNPTSTKQNLNATTDLVVASSTGRKGNHILTNTVDITPNVLTIFSIVPKEATAGEGLLTLTVNGKLFANGGVVRFNGANMATTFVSAAKVTASIPAASLATAGTRPVIVTNPVNVDSNVKNFVVTATNPAPIVTTVAPRRELQGSADFTLYVNGSGFRRSSVVRFNGSNRTTQFVSDNLLTATILASDQLVPGPYPITVVTPSPGGGTSTVTKGTIFYVEPICLAPIPGHMKGVTLFNTNKNQMWYNDGLWWGAFSDDTAGVYFYKQNGLNFSKGALLDSNFNGRPDVLWNGTNLFVLVYEFNTQARFYKYTYNSITKTYALVSGFPVTLPLIGIGSGLTESQTGSVTIAQDSTGKIWATYPGTGPDGDGNYRVIWTTSADHKTWDTNGFILATGGALLTQEVMNIVHFGGNKIGIAWSHQLPPIEDGFRYHIDGEPENVWSAKETIVSGLGPEEGLGGVADNHGSMKAAPDGRIFLVAKDSDNAGYLHLYTRSVAGTWSQPVLISPDPQAATTRPTLLLDLENEDLYVLYEDANQSRMYMSRASMNAPVFAPACPWIDSIYVVDVTSTKQNLNSSMGLMAAASTGLIPSDIYFNSIALTAGTGNAPILSSVSLGAGSRPITLTINGSNFASNAVVYFNGMDRATTFVSAIQLTAKLLSTDVAAPGTYPITVMNPKGGTSTTVNLIIPAVISSLSPASVTAGGAGFTLTLNGAGFVSGATVRFNGVVRPASFVSSTQLTTQISATEIQTFGNFPVTVVNPDGSSSPPSNFAVNNIVPTLTVISPAVRNAGSGAFTLTATGANFNTSSIVNINGVGRATTFVSGTQLTAQILATDVAAGGNFPITIFNPLPGGGTSSAVNLAVNNPVPTLSSISPTLKLAGSPAFSLTVNGTNFNGSSRVRLAGSDRPTTLVSASQLTAQLTAADIQAAATLPITVFNPAPAGGTSSSVNLTVENPVPVMITLLPASKIVGDPAFVLAVNGTGFVNGSVVRFNGSNRSTAFVNSSQLTASLTAADVATVGTPAITVLNPTPGGGTSNVINLPVNNPVPSVTTIAPSTKAVGDASFILTVNGTNFSANSVVQLGGTARPTSLVSSTQLTASISSADVAAAGLFPVTVFNPLPGGGSSGALNLSVENPVPTLSNISPTVKTAGDIAFVLTVNGTNFNASSMVRFNGANRPTTLVNATHLTAQLTAADIQSGGTFPITVFNPTPGGGTSISSNLTVNNPSPAITSISPANKSAGAPAFVLTVNGTGFVGTSIVRLNGSNRTTTFVSNVQLTAQITAADVAATGTKAITVFNPTPVGGTSAAVNLTVSITPPTITSISPTSRSAGGSSFTLTVNGTGFLSTTIIRFNGTNRTTTFVSSTQVTTSIPASDIAAGGFYPITVFNPGTLDSNAINLAVNNPVPTLTSISPTSRTAGTAAFVLTVNGTNFNGSSKVRFNGLDRVTTLVSSTQLTAQITATDIAAGGVIPITVFNPLPSGGTTTAINLTVNNPAPTLTSISPTTAAAGGAALTLTVNGTNFNPGSVVRLNGSNRATTLVSTTQLTAQVTAADIQATGTLPITVFNPTPSGGTSSAINLAVNNPLPAITDILPATKMAGDAAFVLTVNGSGFVSASVVRFNGSNRTTTFFNSNQLTAQLTAADLATAGTPAITVLNPAPGGGTSASVSLAVNNPMPTVTTISPTTKTAGDASFTLTVNGTNFVSTSVIRFNGIDHTTTFVNSTQLTTSITAADIATVGTFPIRVFNGTPGGGSSNTTDLTVNNPAPTLSSINPTTKAAGDAGFTLTVNGTNFNSGSVVRFGGSDRTTTLVNSTQVTAQITAADVLTAGLHAITVFNPLPGGGTSTSTDLTVNNSAPTLSSISPASKTAGEEAFVLTVNGTNFIEGTVVRLNGIDRSTTFVSASQVTAEISAADIQSAAGSHSITVFNPAPGGGTSSVVELLVNNPVPAIGTLTPASILEGNPTFSLTVNGTNFVSGALVQWNGESCNTTFVSATQLSAEIEATNLISVGTASITVTNPGPGGGTSNATTFTIEPNSRILSVVNSSGAANSTVTVPITLASQGDENALSFTLTFNTSLLNSPQAVLGTDVSGATLNTDSSEVDQGRYNVSVTLPAGQTIASGLRQIARITFNTAGVVSQTTTPVGFSGPPLAHGVLNQNAIDLATVYIDGTVTITLGFEADVAPRPNGSNNGTVSVADWVQLGRFASGLDIPNPGSEFQRADCSPKDQQGNGVITISDWVQGGRYASGLDAVLAAGGPSTDSSALIEKSGSGLKYGTNQSSAMLEEAIASKVQLVDAESVLSIDGKRTLTIEMETQGNENALGFSLLFDAAKLAFVSAEKSEELSGATLNVNQLEAAEGRVGIALALPAGRSLGVGRHQLVVLKFAELGDSKEKGLIGFSDKPVAREVVDTGAHSMKTEFQDPLSGMNPLDEAQFFVGQQYLDFLGRGGEAEGMAYWMGRLRECGADSRCVQERRIDVSAAFFMSEEFEETGGTIYRLYRATYGGRPSYAQYQADRGQLVGGATLAESTAAYVKKFVQRAEFQQRYPETMGTEAFVAKLYETAGLSGHGAARRQALVGLGRGEQTRAQVLGELIELPEFKEREYNGAFVLMQYFGYLRREPDAEGYSFWLNVLNQREPGNYRGMVCSFLTSREYQERFSTVVTRSNADCRQ